MTEEDCLKLMIPPGKIRPAKAYRGGVIQILVTSNCDKSCFSCTQSSQLARKKEFMTPEMFEQAVLSLSGFFGVTATFGGNPALSPWFKDYCAILRKHVPRDHCGIWSNNPITLENAQEMSRTYDNSISNLNVHLDQKAFDLFKAGWPASNPVGLHADSRHSPPFVSMIDLGVLESERWDLISHCPINQHWSASMGIFRGQLRAWFCEISMSQDLMHQDDPEWPDNGIPIPVPQHILMRFHGQGSQPPHQSRMPRWWELPMIAFRHQVLWSCHRCSVPLNGYGELSQSESPDSREQVSQTHLSVMKPKRKGRTLELVTDRKQLEEGRIKDLTRYLQNGKL